MPFTGPSPPSSPLTRYATAAWRRATASLRTLPDFLIIGAAKAGTTSLYEYLVQHPDVRPAARKEVHFFDVYYDRGPRWYRARFPLATPGRRWITGEASPYYLQHPLVPARVRSLLPDVRLIVLLREPVERAFSHYRHYVRTGEENRSFAEVIAEEERSLPELEERARAGDPEAIGRHRRVSLLARGRYAEQLERWFEHFGREQLLVLSSDELFTEPARAFARTLAFLGLAPAAGVRFDVYNPGAPDEIDSELAARLAELFAEPNRRLVELLGPEFAWGTRRPR